MFRSHISPSNHAKLVKLVGEKCEIRCKIENKVTQSLWDTGAQVSVVSQKWLDEEVPEAKLRDVKELLDEPLRIQAANKKSIPYNGWVELSFQPV